ncbi:MAG: HAD hydrolase family protein [Candidatus Marinimicrobia bacterium]|nr:HAD hydrolase family protein [Candidatus Neomarinimicrobiota bacterium]
MRLFMPDVKNLCAKIKMLISDVDGVLTDGSVYKGSAGEEFKRFTVIDGAGAAIARAAGLNIALISGRHSEATAIRAAEMKITELHNGTLDKRGPYKEIKEKYNLKDDEIAYVGDDIIDIVIMKQVGVPIAVANAYKTVKDISVYVTEKSGGQGAFREAIEWILIQQGRLEEVLTALQDEVQNPPETDPYH